MALQAFHTMGGLNLVDNLTEKTSGSLRATRSSKGEFEVVGPSSSSKFMVIGHRGYGMNKLQSSDHRMKFVKENTILSFNTAASFPIDFIEFDVQVTKDGCPIIFHDDFILSHHQQGIVYEKRVTDLTLTEFISYGPQKHTTKPTLKPLLRKTKDDEIQTWSVESDDSLCTLQDAFTQLNTNPSLGFNIELKFDDHVPYQPSALTSSLLSILQVVVSSPTPHRPIIFSSFHPDAAILMRKLQDRYPVLFLTNGGGNNHDMRRNGLDEAMSLCKEGGLQGVVSEAKAVFREPQVVEQIKNANLTLFTYGELNNVVEAVCLQRLMGVDGVIVDFVKEITEAVSKYSLANEGDEEEELVVFSKKELSFLLRLIPELIHQ